MNCSPFVFPRPRTPDTPFAGVARGDRVISHHASEIARVAEADGNAGPAELGL